MKNNKYSQFRDDELYMLKRQAIESSYNIVCEGKYDENQIKMHTKLLNEIIDEIKFRGNK